VELGGEPVVTPGVERQQAESEMAAAAHRMKRRLKLFPPIVSSSLIIVAIVGSAFT
jgi:hypothetical protein